MISHSALAAVALLLVSRQVTGLSYAEHERISSLAFASAVEAVLRGSSGNLFSPDDVAALIALQDGDTARNLPSYGELAAKVDYVLDEREYFRAGLQPCIGEWAELDLERVSAIGKSRVDLLVSTLRDEAHFQKETLRAAVHWHSQALDVARHRRHCDLVGALVRSAIAAHFLEDFLTPGHVFASKDGRPAADTLSLHNLFNRGARLRITDRAWLERTVAAQDSTTIERLAADSGCPVADLVARWTDRGIWL